MTIDALLLCCWTLCAVALGNELAQIEQHIALFIGIRLMLLFLTGGSKVRRQWMMMLLMMMRLRGERAHSPLVE